MPVVLRVTPCLDVDAGRVVKGVDFENLRDAGDPVELASRCGTEGTDEITLLDVSVLPRGRTTVLDVVARTAEEVFVPFAVGGGVRSVEDVARLLAHDADKTGISTAAIAGPDLISRIADCFDDQVLVLSVDVHGYPGGVTTTSGFEMTAHGGKRSTGIDALEWALKATSLGAGEILLNSMNADGVRTSFDLEMLNVFRSEVTIPLIASGGAGTSKHFLETVRTGADVLLAASAFHFGEVAIPDAKNALHTQGFKIRIRGPHRTRALRYGRLGARSGG